MGSAEVNASYSRTRWSSMFHRCATKAEYSHHTWWEESEAEQLLQFVLHLSAPSQSGGLCFLWGSELQFFFFVSALTIHHHPPLHPSLQRRPSILSVWRLSSPRRSREGASVWGGGPGSEPGGAAAWAGTDRGERLLAAVQEGRGVGALMAAEVGVRLPALTLLLPATMQDPDEGLKNRTS